MSSCFLTIHVLSHTPIEVFICPLPSSLTQRNLSMLQSWSILDHSWEAVWTIINIQIVMDAWFVDSKYVVSYLDSFSLTDLYLPLSPIHTHTHTHFFLFDFGFVFFCVFIYSLIFKFHFGVICSKVYQFF